MYQVIRGSQNGHIGIRIKKKLTQDDYELLIPYIARLRQQANSVSLLCDMRECEGPASHMLWGDLVDRLKELYEIPRVAIVVDEQQWLDSKTNDFYPSFNTTVKYFTPAQLDKAWKWVEEDEP